MRSLIKLFILVALFISSLAQAETIKSSCYAKAASETAKFYQGPYDQDGFEAMNCVSSEVGKAILCDVAATKGHGAAMDTYRVVLNPSCSKALRIDLTGEE